MDEDQKQNESQTLINLGIVRNDKGEVLIIKRVKKEIGADQSTLTWAFPGGKQHLDETRQECVEREILAETGYKVTCLKEISIRMPRQFVIVLVYHLCQLAEPNPIVSPQQPWEVEEVKWVKPEEFKNYFTTDLDPNVAKELGI